MGQGPFDEFAANSEKNSEFQKSEKKKRELTRMNTGAASKISRNYQRRTAN